MMTAAFGDETASSMSLLPPAAAASEDDTTDENAKAKEPARCSEEQQQGRQGVPGRQLMEDRWPGGGETPFVPGGGNGSPAPAWPRSSGGNGMMDSSDFERGQLGMEVPPRLGEQPRPDPFAMERPPVLHANGGGGAAAAAQGSGSIGGGEIRAKPPARREWRMSTTKPTPSFSSTPVGAAAAVDPTDYGKQRGAGIGVARSGGGVATGAGLTPPKWLPDENTLSCSGCGKDFDWIRRRHHCRLCGGIFCYTCSQFRALLPRSFGSRDPQRLCQPCNARVAPLQETLAESMSNAVKENEVEQGTLASYLNRPIVFTLGAEVRKAAYTVHNFTKEGVIQDQSIPQELLSHAKGLAFLTVIKGGFIVAGRVGTGLVVAKTDEGVWSAPSAIATVGMGWGALIGGEITDFVLVLNTDAALEAFSGRGQVSIGAELSVAVGPVGRTGAGNVSVASQGVAHAYSYSHSRGLFAGLSLEGGVIVSRPDVNRKFYGRQISVRELLSGNVTPPPAARPLYEALENRGSAADQQRLLSQGFRVGSSQEVAVRRQRLVFFRFRRTFAIFARPGPKAELFYPTLPVGVDRMKCHTRWAQALLALLFMTMILLEVVDGSQKQAKPRRRRIKKSRAGVGKDFSEFLLVIGAIMTCVIAPVFAFFLHSIYKDPASPELARACWRAVKDKLLSYLGGQQPALRESSLDRDNAASGPSSLRRAGRRRKINTVDDNNSSNEATFWPSDKFTASQITRPATIGTTAMDRLYAVDDDRTKHTTGNTGNVRFGDRDYLQEKELSERRPDSAAMAPHSSGALFPPWKAGGGAGIRPGARHEAASPPRWWREGGSRAAPSVRRAGFLGGREEYDFGSSGRGVEWDPYPDVSYDDEDDEHEPAGRASESRSVHKSARSKRRMSRSKRSRAVKGPRSAGAGLDGGWARHDAMGGRTSFFS
eukprot:g6654.t1